MIDFIRKRVKFFLKTLSYRIPNIFFKFSPIKIYEYKELIKDVIFSKIDTILDIGCGDGLQTILLGKKCKKIYGTDISNINLKIAKTRSLYIKKKFNIKFKHVKDENLRFKTAFFDKIFCICALEHIVNYLNVLKETYRVLKKGGQIFLSLDSLESIKDEKMLQYHKKKYFVEHYFRKEDLTRKIKDIGFKNVNIYPIFNSNYAQKIFVYGIYNNFRYGYISAILKYFILKFTEMRCRNKNKGLFLIAKCYK